MASGLYCRYLVSFSFVEMIAQINSWNALQVLKSDWVLTSFLHSDVSFVSFNMRTLISSSCSTNMVCLFEHGLRFVFLFIQCFDKDCGWNSTQIQKLDVKILQLLYIVVQTYSPTKNGVSSYINCFSKALSTTVISTLEIEFSSNLGNFCCGTVHHRDIECTSGYYCRWREGTCCFYHMTETSIVFLWTFHVFRYGRSTYITTLFVDTVMRSQNLLIG